MKLTNFALFVPLVAATSFRHVVNPVARTAEVSYDGYHVYSITPSSPQEARNIGKRFANYHTHPIRDTLSVAIPPQEIDSFEALSLNAHLLNSDLGKYIRSTDKSSSYNKALHKRGDLPDLSWYDTYHPYTDHLQYWDDLVHAFPKNLEKFAIGKSYENRTIHAFHLHGDQKKGRYGEQKARKPVILWHATVHAREWISTTGKLLF